MDQQRRVLPPALPAASSSSSSPPLLGIADDFYELLQHSSPAATRPRLFSDPIIPALKMEPELGDFIGASYTWGTQFATVPQHLYNDTNTLTSLTNYAPPLQLQPPPIVEAATQFAAYTPPAAPSGGVVATSTGAQIQALRDFMVYGNLGTAPAAMSSRATTPVGGFYSCDDGAEPGGIPSMAYRALCSELYATTERSPHRSQFQRENHILAERQRREEMNEKFSALRAMIPKATKKDKASIVGDTIDYVLELEKRLKQLQACKDKAAGSGVKKRKLADSPKEGNGAGSTSSETTSAAPVQPAPRGGDCSPASSPSDHAAADSQLQSGKTTKEAATQVDVQQLGKQAVVKVVCNRQPGHVLRVLNALEECKVEVLQSNVMTVADHSIHFVTVQLEEGVSAPTEELVSAVLQAINSAEG